MVRAATLTRGIKSGAGRSVFLLDPRSLQCDNVIRVEADRERNVKTDPSLFYSNAQEERICQLT